MKGYLGNFEVAVDSDKTPQQWALDWIARCGGHDGEHHKDWVLDQVARILHGTPVIVEEARWDNGHTELRYSTGEPTKAYYEWVKEIKSGEDGPETYDYSTGIAP
jgi:hypothetical protein